MIVRNIHDKEVLDTTYIAHGGAIAQMILDRRILKEIGFLAIARLAPGRQIEAHVDPMGRCGWAIKPGRSFRATRPGYRSVRFMRC
jgi:hypothetical protein